MEKLTWRIRKESKNYSCVSNELDKLILSILFFNFAYHLSKK